MTMTPYSADLTRSLKWLQNNAPRITSLINQKADWYQLYLDQFWINWQRNVFDLRTANTFGLVIWCIILGIPLDLFDFEEISSPWAFGNQRGNYIDGGGHVGPFAFVGAPAIQANGETVSPTGYTIDDATGSVSFEPGFTPGNGTKLTWTGTITQNKTGQELIIQQPRQFGVGDGATTTFSLVPANSAHYNELGDNFYGGGNSSVSSLSEIRLACQLRYIALVSNGRQAWINQMLRFIFNGDEAWDFPNKKYVYLTDNTMESQPVTGETIFQNDWQGNIALDNTPHANFLPHSDPAAWPGGVKTITRTGLSAPDGSLTSSAFSSNSNANLFTESIHVETGNRYTISGFVKQGSAASFVFGGGFNPEDGLTIGYWDAYVFNQDGTITRTDSDRTYVQDVVSTVAYRSDGWIYLRFSFTSELTANAAASLWPAFDFSGPIAGDTESWGWTFQNGDAQEAYIPTNGAAVALTDYTLDAETGEVTLAQAPAVGAVLTWEGSWGWAETAAPQEFGVGNGIQTDFTLTKPPGFAGDVTQSNYMEYRVGAGMGLSDQFLNILNDPSYGIMPQCAGIKYAVVQES